MLKSFHRKNMNPTKTFHRHSLRLKDYDYSQAGAYFITLCTFQRRNLFGEIQHEMMLLNNLGCIASAQLLELPNHFSFLELGEWIVMPNHIHAILILNDKGEASRKDNTNLPKPHGSDASPLRPNGTAPGSIGAVIQNYKSLTSRRITDQWEKLKGSIWQRNYYEHIIRNERELQAITDYIQTNPQNWEKDTEYVA